MFIRVSFVVVIALITVSSHGANSEVQEGINVSGSESTKPDNEYDEERKIEEEIHKFANEIHTERNPIIEPEPKTPTPGTAPGKHVCTFPVDEGQCFANFAYWGYKPELNACEKFHYGGCDGNDNRFDTLEECIETCVTT